MVVQLQAETLCQQHGSDFSRVFRYQYHLRSRKLPAVQVPKGWARHQHRQWHLYHGTKLALSRLVDRSGTAIGLLWGVAVRHECDDSGQWQGHVLGRRVAVDLDARAEDAEQRFLEFLHDLAGRYALIVTLGGKTKLYADGAGDMGIYVDPAEKTVGSSLFTTITRPLRLRDGVDLDAVRAGNQVLRLGQTADAEVQRICPNHALDLSTFESHRHWPDAKLVDLLQRPSPEAPKSMLLDAIAGRFRANLDALISAKSCSVPLSGGKDSRILLALVSPEIRKKITRVFSHSTNKMTSYDTLVARKVAEQLDLPITVIYAVMLVERSEGWAKAAQKSLDDRWLAGGYLIYDLTLYEAAAIDGAPVSGLVLRGNAMAGLEARGFPPVKRRKEGLFSDAVLTRVMSHPANAPPSPEDKAGFDTWASSMPAGLPSDHLADMAFLEQIHPYSTAVRFTANSKAFYMNPFNDRLLFALTMQYPIADRFRGELVDALLEKVGMPYDLLPRPSAFINADKDKTLIASHRKATRGYTRKLIRREKRQRKEPQAGSPA